MSVEQVWISKDGKRTAVEELPDYHLRNICRLIARDEPGVRRQIAERHQDHSQPPKMGDSTDQAGELIEAIFKEAKSRDHDWKPKAEKEEHDQIQ